MRLGNAKSQSPLCGENAAKKDADWDGELRLDLTTSLSARTLGDPRMVVLAEGWPAEHRVVTTILTSKPETWHGRSRHNQTGYPPGWTVCSSLKPKRQEVRAKTRLTPRTPSFTRRLVWSHWTSERSALVMLWIVDLRTESKTWSDWCDADGEQRSRWRTSGECLVELSSTLVGLLNCAVFTIKIMQCRCCRF